MTKFASLCVLAYKRPQQLKDCLESIWQTTDYPYQLIVNVDGADTSSFHYLIDKWEIGKISNLILIQGDNRGVGRSFQNCLGVAEGDYIFKIDTDLTFKPGWLSTSIKILDSNPDIGAVSLFDYNHYDPNDERFKPSECHLEVKSDCIIVKDFVSSVYGFRTVDRGKIEPVEDDGNHTKLSRLAITKEDLVKNSGFGKQSVYVIMVDDNPEHAYKTPTYNEPLIFKKGYLPDL